MNRETQFPAESERRTENNLMRHKYRQLSDNEKASMVRVKDLGDAFVHELHRIGRTLLPDGGYSDDVRQGSRELAVAQTKIEEAVMWAVKHVTR